MKDNLTIIARFPSDFRFQLNETEKNELVTNCDRFKTLKHSTSNPYTFTEQGVSMLSAILKSDIAVETSIKIIREFVNMRKFVSQNNNLSIYEYKNSHDRFLILDNKIIYHLGASIKDLGNKWFAFSKLEDDNFELLKRIDNILGDK